jgi:hypothetical protein
MLNTGAGYAAVSSATALKSGDRLMVNPNSSAKLTYADGCSIELKPSVITIGEKSPCSVKAQGFLGGGAGGGFGGGGLLGSTVGFGIIGGVGGAMWGVDHVSSP